MLEHAWKPLLVLISVLTVSCSWRHSGILPENQGDAMRTTCQVRHITVSINRSPGEVYAFVANPENLPKWATGLGDSITNVHGEWIADAPMGKVMIKFAEKNEFGILDHEVVLESGVKVYNPMRVIANGTGSEIFFTLIRQPDMSDEQFAQDTQWVENDLNTLKGLMENQGSDE